jgi:hypothetical protein
MLDEASMSSAMRRPGKVVSERVSAVRGSASARMKKGRPASASSRAPWRAAAALDQRRQRHPVMAGIAIAERADDHEDRRQPDQRDQHLASRRDLGVEQAVEAQIAPLGPCGRDDAADVTQELHDSQARRLAGWQASRLAG